MDTSLIVGIALGLVAVWACFIALVWVLRPSDVRLGELVRLVPDILRLVRDLLGDRSVPASVRLSLLFLLAWLVSPIDLIPEFVPVLGPLDDVVVAVIVLRYERRRLGEDDLRRRWRGTTDGFELLGSIMGGTRR